MTNYNLDDAAVSLKRMGITYEDAQETLADGNCLVVCPAEDTYEECRIALIMEVYGVASDKGDYLRKGNANERELRNTLNQIVAGLEKEYIASNGQIYLGYEEPYTTDIETVGMLYYFTIWDGNLIFIHCQYELSDEEDYSEAAEELVRTTVDGIYDSGVTKTLPDCGKIPFAFINTTDGSDIKPIKYGYLYGIFDHTLVEKNISDTDSEDINYYHSYKLAGVKEKQDLEVTAKCLNLKVSNTLYSKASGAMYAYDENPKSAVKTRNMYQILTAWSKDSGGEWKRLSLPELIKLFQGSKPVEDCEELYTVVLRMNKEGQTDALMMTYASCEDTIKFMSGSE